MRSESALAACREAHRARFGASPEVEVRAPGRVNLIGEHTDYNDGFVLPIAIQRGITFVGTPRTERRLRLFSVDFGRGIEVSLDEPFASRAERWADYVEGVARVIAARSGRDFGGFDAVFSGDIPQGAGLSSSAALEVAAGYFIREAFGFKFTLEDLARHSRDAENQYAGVQCGIMDQFASCLCRKDTALFLDCRDLSYEAVPFRLDGAELLILDTTVSRGLVDSQYNERRRACEKGTAIFAGLIPGTRALRDVSAEAFETHGAALPEDIRGKCRHVITENDRVRKSVDALKAADLKRFGALMNESHRSLRDDYKVTCPELDLLHDTATRLPGCIGERMTGGGFGGCAIALVESGARDEFVGELSRAYRDGAGRELKIHPATPEDGVRRL